MQKQKAQPKTSGKQPKFSNMGKPMGKPDRNILEDAIYGKGKKSGKTIAIKAKKK